MSVFSKIRGFFSRNRNKFIIGGIAISGTILLVKYAQQKLIDWQETETKKFIEKTRKTQHFESTERTCNQTILSLIDTLNESVSKAIDTNAIIAHLQTNPENKLELWEKLKVMVYTKSTCLIYLLVMLVVTLRIQLNIVGGYLFKDPNSVSTEMQQQYLLLCNNLFDSGLQKLSSFINKEYTKILGPMDLKKQVKLKDFDDVFWAIQTKIAMDEINPIEHFSEYIITEPISEEDSIYNNMIKDTADLLESDEVKCLMAHCINRGFVLLTDQLSEYYTTGNEKIKEVPSSTPTTTTFTHPADMEIRLAKLIPIINGLCLKKSLPEKFTRQLLMNDKMKTFGANVYECFSHSK